MQPRPHRKHREDQRKQTAIDKGKRLIRVDAAGDQNKGHRDDGEQKNGRHVERGQDNNPDQCRNGDGRMTPAIGTGRRMTDIDHLHIGRQPLNVLRGPFEQQRIANLDDQFIQLTPDVLVPAVHRQRIDTIPPAQPHGPQRTPYHPASRCDQHLDGGGLDR